jgi:hypothetical protein
VADLLMPLFNPVPLSTLDRVALHIRRGLCVRARDEIALGCHALGERASVSGRPARGAEGSERRASVSGQRAFVANHRLEHRLGVRRLAVVIERPAKQVPHDATVAVVLHLRQITCRSFRATAEQADRPEDEDLDRLDAILWIQTAPGNCSDTGAGAALAAH